MTGMYRLVGGDVEGLMLVMWRIFLEAQEKIILKKKKAGGT